MRPDARVAARLAAEIAGHDERVLLLGVTRELAGLGRALTAVDWSEEAVARLWIGDAADRHAVLADWCTMELPPACFTAVIGDGSLSALACPDDYIRVFDRLAGALVPGGRMAIRCFVAPDLPETLGRIVDDVRAGREPSYNAVRWRVAMAAAAGRDNVRVADIYHAFAAAFPDRRALSERTGWSIAAIDLIDAYRDSPLVYSFPTRDVLAGAVPAAFADPRFVSSGDYPLSDRCPFLVADRAA